MRIRLAFLAITTAVLAVVACQPGSTPEPSPSPVSVCGSPDWPEPVCDPSTLRDYGF